MFGSFYIVSSAMKVSLLIIDCWRMVLFLYVFLVIIIKTSLDIEKCVLVAPPETKLAGPEG